MPPRTQQRGQLRAAFAHELHLLFSLVNFTCKAAGQTGQCYDHPSAAGERRRAETPPDSPKTLTVPCGGIRGGSSRTRRRPQAFRFPPMPNHRLPLHTRPAPGACGSPAPRLWAPPPACRRLAPAWRPPAGPAPCGVPPGCGPGPRAALGRPAWPPAPARPVPPPALPVAWRRRRATGSGQRAGGGPGVGAQGAAAPLWAAGFGWGGRQAAGPGGCGHRRAPSFLPEALPLFAGAVLLGVFIFPVVVLSLCTTRIKYCKNPSCFS